ncbi:hypothetical protein [Kaistia terrae]|uniref:Phage tail lysozyme domain-containing protein n=1 Tax=Kaistia terrae TaxID=537017 RepID=A0ABW0Q4V3_9HYPH|nr:hypothetical protein [Kaistia terrae]MCX5581586.1 hypothetical protein [Kaistia terrae]
MADYAKFLFDAFSAPGDAIQKNRDYAAKLQETKDRNARDDQRFDYQVKNDDRNYLRQMGIDDANADYRAQSLDLQRRSVERQDAIAARPNIETFYDSEGRETRGFYDPESETGFRPVGGAKTNTANIPNAYQPRPEGGLTFIPGGPADPEVVARLAGVRGEAKPGRPLPAMTIKDLGTKGQAVDDMGRLTEGFQDGYSGYKTSWAGDISNTVGRNLGLGLGDQGDWWSDYQSRKNLIRNQLFGAALTAQEKGEFDKADINPGMTPTAIRMNLARQQELATNAARKMATAYAQQGYSRDAIESALGMSLDDIGGSPRGNGSGRQQQTPSYQPQDIEAEMRRRGIM